VTSRPSRSRTARATAALVAALALGAPAAARATTPSAADSSSTATPTVTPVGAGAATVVLPTGDRVTVGTGTGSHATLTVNHDAGASDAFANFTVGGDRYVVPSEAAPYAGRVLDLSLFDVTKLAAAAPAPGARIPVQLRFAAGVTPAAPAGVTLTAVSGQSATGYLTPDSAHAFAQALRDAIKADVAAGKPAGSGAPFGGLTSMARLGASTPVQPNYPLHILQLNALDDTGAPGNLQIILINVDNARAFNTMTATYQGIAKVAVPAGNYAAIGIDFAFDPAAQTLKTELIPVEGITVPATGTVPAVTVDARTATTPVTFTTQKPSTALGGSVEYIRTAVTGGGGGVQLDVSGAGLSSYVAPTPKPAVGSAAYTTNWIGQSPASAAAPYRYNLAAFSDHIDANQSYAPADSTLATLRHTVNLDPHYGSTPPLIGSGFVTDEGWSVLGFEAPDGKVTEYVTGGLRWVSVVNLPSIFDPTDPNSGAPAILNDDAVQYNAGQTAARTWAYAPMAPNFGQHTAAPANLFGCQACSGVGNIDVLLGMLGDSNRDTTGLDFGAAGSSQLYWNGKLVSSDTGRFGYTIKDVPAGPATIRTVFDYDRTAGGITQSPKTHTDVTIPYSGKDDPRMALPAGTECAAAEISTTPDAPCQILPALTLNYQLNGLDRANTSHSPTQNLVLNVGHMSYGGVGSKAHVDSAKVSVSFDNGATWQDVPTHGGDGTYAAHWRNPAPGSPVELRVTATDCLGGSITQTVTNPYTVG